MSASAGEIGLDLVLNSNGFSNSMSGIESMAKKAATALAAAFSVQKIISFASECIELGSDLAEVQNVVDVTFSTMSESVNAWAKSAAESFGLSETMAKQYVGTFGSMAEAFGFTEAEAYDMSTALTGLVGDVSSFYNLDQDTAYTKLKAVFSGETESLKDLGIVMTQTALDSYALANGFGKTTSEMTEAEKVTLRMAFVTDQLSNAAGDFERTSDSWANQTRILSLQMDSLKASIGQGLINALTPALKMLNSLIAKLEEAAAVFEAFTEEIFGFSSTDSGTSAAADDLDSAADSASSVTDSLEEASRYLAGFDVMTKASSTNETSSTSAAASSLGSTGTSSSATLSVGVETDVDLSGMQDIKDMLDNFQMQINNFVENLPALEFDCDWEIVKDNLITTAENTLGTILNIGSAVITIGIDFLNDIDLDELIESFSGVLESASGLAEAFTGTIGPACVEFYETGISPIVEWVGDKLKDALDKIAGYLDSWAEWWEENRDGFKELAHKLGEVVANLWALIEPLADKAWDTFWDVIDKINDVVQDFCQWLIDHSDETAAGITAIVAALIALKTGLAISNTISKVSTAMTAATAATSATSGAASGLWATLKANPIILVVAAIAALAAGLFALYNNNETVKEAVDTAWAKIQEVIQVVVEWFQTTVQPIIEEVFGAIATFFTDTFLPAAQSVFETVLSAVGAVVDFFVNTMLPDIQDCLAAVANAFSSAWELIKVVWDIVSPFFSGIWEAIKTAFSMVGPILSGFFKTAWELIKGVWSVASSFFQTIWNTIAGVFDVVKSVLTGDFQGAWDAIKKIFSGVGEFFTGVWDTITETFSNIGSAIGGAIEGAVTGAINTVLNTAGTIINGFISAINTAIDIINAIPGVNIGKLDELEIPQLAEGGYVEANTPQLAVIGDNKNQGEVVAPEDKLQAMANAAAGGSTEVLNKILNISEQVLAAVQDGADIVLMVDSEELARATSNGSMALKRRYVTTAVSMN